MGRAGIQCGGNDCGAVPLNTKRFELLQWCGAVQDGCSARMHPHRVPTYVWMVIKSQGRKGENGRDLVVVLV